MLASHFPVSADAMSIQLSIIEALEASRSAILSGLEELKTLRAERLAMEARAAALEAQVASLQAQSAKIVDPEAVQPLLDKLARAIEETYAAVTAEMH